MHIHSANLNPAPLPVHSSPSALAVRRASEIRQKLIGAESELEAASGLSDPLVTAVAGGYAGSSHSGSASQNSAEPNAPAEDAPRGPSTESSTVSTLISFWA